MITEVFAWAIVIVGLATFIGGSCAWMHRLLSSKPAGPAFLVAFMGFWLLFLVASMEAVG